MVVDASSVVMSITDDTHTKYSNNENMQLQTAIVLLVYLKYIKEDKNINPFIALK